MLRRPVTSLALLCALSNGACSLPFAIRGGRIAKSFPDRDQADDDPDTGSATDDTAVGTGDSVVDSVADAEDPSDWLFSLDAVHQVDISLSDASLASLEADPFTYVPADLTFDGTFLGNVGIHVKGRLGSYREMSGKPGFKVDINHYQDVPDFHGRNHLTFNNLVQDSSFVHQPTAYAVYRALGLPAPRIGYAWIRVNGADYGLYENAECYDQDFLDRTYEHPDGNLYNGDYYLYPDWSSYIFVDFDTASQGYFELVSGTDVGLADVAAVTAALDANSGSDAFNENVGALVDLDYHRLAWAIENWVGQYDGYSYNKNNYYVYFDPDDGRAEILPWDHDWAFYSSIPLSSPAGRLSSACLAVPSCREAFLAALNEVCGRFDAGTVDNQALVEEIEARITLINGYAEADPRKEASMDSIRASQRDLLNWVATRSPSLRSYWGL